MSLKCKLGIHQWDGCICTACNRVRSSHHDLKEDCEKCTKCGTEFHDNHDWSKNCEKCAKCGKSREYGHSWHDNCEKCAKCGQERTDKHKMVNGVCTICGHGVFVDEDRKKYQIIRIGDNILMAENYAKKPGSGEYWVYENENSNISKYGYLYDFETAKNMAPKGWHLPTKGEWESVLNISGEHSNSSIENLQHGGHSGFDAVYGGYRSNFGNFIGEKGSAHFWSSTQDKEDKAWHFKIIAFEQNAGFHNSEISHGMSVRYFKDKE